MIEVACVKYIELKKSPGSKCCQVNSVQEAFIVLVQFFLECNREKNPVFPSV